jgi:hypothetical protein
VDEKENPLEIVLELKRNAVLGMVVENVESLSVKKNDMSNSLLKRNLQKGTKQVKAEVDGYEQTLVLEYAGNYFSNYVNQSEENAFTYEMEYLLCGKADSPTDPGTA